MDKSKRLYIGGYKGQDPHCLHFCDYDARAGSIAKIESYQIDNSSYLCFSPDRKYLYTVIEQDDYKGRIGGGIAAYAIENDGRLRFINDSYTEGGYPCHLSVSDDGKTLYAANYTGGSSVYFALLPDGGIGDKKVLIDHNGFGPASHTHGGRQQRPHAHYIRQAPHYGVTNIWVCDLGLDAVLVLDEAGNELSRFTAPPGFGPRHLIFHPVLPFVYVLGELSCSVIALEYDFNKTFSMYAYPEVPVLEGPVGNTTCAAIRVSPDCKHLLVSNRIPEKEGSVSILGLQAGGVTGLEKIVPSGGCWPRDFNFDPEGGKVLVANEHSNRVSVFDWHEGNLTPTGGAFEVQKPTCVLFGE